jgi:hypothetical protein
MCIHILNIPYTAVVFVLCFYKISQNDVIIV